MTTYDITIASAVARDRSHYSLAAAAIVLILLGVTALMAPETEQPPTDWHGNAALSVPLSQAR